MILLCLFWILEIFCVYRYMFKDKSLKWKAVTSTFFVLAGLAAYFSIGTTAAIFANLMLLGLVASWIGDVTLGIDLFGMKGIVGIVFFMAAHFIYIAAFSSLLKSDFGLPLFSITQLIPWAVLLCVAAAFFIITKFKFGATFIPVLLYAAVICFMVAKALTLSYKVFLVGGNNLFAVFAAMGSVMFLMSDMGVCSMMFGGKKDLPIGKKKFSLDNFNLVTYYGAQMMLASIILIKEYPL